MSLKVHHLNNSRSQRILWLLEELGTDYEIVHHQRDAVTNLAPPELLEVHPLGKSPVITDVDEVMAESGAIVEYLAGRDPQQRLLPAPGTPEQLRWRYWLHFAEGSAMPFLLMKLVFDEVARARMPFFARPIARAISHRVQASFVLPNIAAQLDFIESELARHAWFAGDRFSAADVQMSFPLEACAARGTLQPGQVRIRAWRDAIHARPAYQRALQKGGPYRILGS